MKLISEDEIKEILGNQKPSVFYIPKGRILSPSAKDYLNRQLIGVDVEKNRPDTENICIPDEKKGPVTQQKKETVDIQVLEKKTYRDYETGALYNEKPEFMTHMYGNQLVRKDTAMIRYRGKLDRLQAEIVLAQSVICKDENSQSMIRDLDEILHVCRELMRCELMKEPVHIETVLGLNKDELREHSHHSIKYYHVNTMDLPNYTKGTGYAYLNLIRTSVREAELMAVEAFREGRTETRTDILEVLNRLSSAMHIMMCKYTAGMYGV